MSPPDLHLRPKLASHVRLKIDPITGEPILLFPEGLLVLNETAHEIVRHCQGELTIADLVRNLSEEFAASEVDLQADVLENLEQLRRQNLLHFLP